MSAERPHPSEAAPLAGSSRANEPTVASIPHDHLTRAQPEGALRRAVRGARSVAGSVRRQVAALSDRAMHPRRRKRALEALRSLPPVNSVLFVCHGNIYRSPYAEATYRRWAEKHGGPAALSAGFVGPDRPAPSASVELARSRGMDLTAHRSQLLTAPLVGSSGLIVVMSGEQKREICNRFGYPARRVLVLGDLDPESGERRTVIDPWNRPPEVLRSAADRIERCVQVLTEEIGARMGGRARESGDADKA